jgi:putative serine protease PepD
VIEGVGARPEAGEGEGYGAYLGTVPDFTFTERGVRLGGVTGGSPADRAGLRSGDVMIGFSGRDIEDLYGLTAALRSHAPGDTVAITVLRDGTEVRVTAVLGDRSRDRH